MSTQIYPNAFGSSSSSVEVNGAAVPSPSNFNTTLPIAPTGSTNGTWSSDGAGNISVSLLVSTNASITVNSVPYSDDYEYFVNHVDKNNLINSTIPQNASPAYVNGGAVA